MAQTIKELLAYIEEVKPNDYSDEIKVRWLNELEGMVQTELLLLPVEGIIRYKWPEDQDAELIVKEPHDKIYEDFLLWKLDQMMGEAERANNSGAIFNDAWSEYARWIAMNIDPQGGYAERNLYYLTAYQTAVKLGFVGSEEEWIESLRGEQGPEGKGLQINGRFDTLEELIEAVPEPEKGDAYMVGEFLYIYDDAEWVNCGKLRGEKGEPGEPGQPGEPGEPGQDGFSPYVTVEDIRGGHRITITDADGDHIFDVMDGQGGGGGTGDHRDLTNRDAANQHPISAITGLRDALDEIPEVIEAEEIGFDTEPTDGSQNLLTSGAIKEALDKIPGGGGGEKHWQLIKNAVVPADPSSDTSGVTWVTNANGIYRFVIDDDNDGNPFSYKKVRLIVKTPSKEAGGCCTGNFKPLIGVNIPSPTDNKGWVFMPYQMDKDWASVILDVCFGDFTDPFVKTDFGGNANAAWGVYPSYYENYASFHRENLSVVDAECVLDKKVHSLVLHVDTIFKTGVIVELYAEV